MRAEAAPPRPTLFTVIIADESIGWDHDSQAAFNNLVKDIQLRGISVGYDKPLEVQTFQSPEDRYADIDTRKLKDWLKIRMEVAQKRDPKAALMLLVALKTRDERVYSEWGLGWGLWTFCKSPYELDF